MHDVEMAGNAGAGGRVRVPSPCEVEVPLTAVRGPGVVSRSPESRPVPSLHKNPNSTPSPSSYRKTRTKTSITAAWAKQNAA
jgi:hypothetical protein